MLKFTQNFNIFDILFLISMLRRLNDKNNFLENKMKSKILRENEDRKVVGV